MNEMIVTCNDRDRILNDGTAEEWNALALHSEVCRDCAAELRAWNELSAAAREMHRDWESPELWPRIARELKAADESSPSWIQRLVSALRTPALSWQPIAAGVLLIALTAATVWLLLPRRQGPIPARQALLKDSAVEQVERAESEYVRAIDKLAVEAQPQIANPTTPLMASYREKLLVLDSAIADLHTQASLNPANAHLRRQLLAMYREKQDTLEQILEERQ